MLSRCASPSLLVLPVRLPARKNTVCASCQPHSISACAPHDVSFANGRLQTTVEHGCQAVLHATRWQCDLV